MEWAKIGDSEANHPAMLPAQGFYLRQLSAERLFCMRGAERSRYAIPPNCGGILLRKFKWSPIKAGAAIIGGGVLLTILILAILLILAIFKLRDIVN